MGYKLYFNKNILKTKKKKSLELMRESYYSGGLLVTGSTTLSQLEGAPSSSSTYPEWSRESSLGLHWPCPGGKSGRVSSGLPYFGFSCCEAVPPPCSRRVLSTLTGVNCDLRSTFPIFLASVIAPILRGILFIPLNRGN